MSSSNEPTSLPDKEAILPIISESRTPRVPRYMVPFPGHAWNPLRTLPRNNPCPCRSGKKFKKCCLPTLPQAVSQKHAEEFKQQIKLPDLVFVTKENQEQIVEEVQAKDSAE